VRGDPEKVDATGGVLDDEERVQPAQGNGVEVKQIAGQDECGRLTWPRLVRLSSSVLAPPSGVVVVAGGVSSSVLAPPLDG
jgi:hypothetical protein